MCGDDAKPNYTYKRGEHVPRKNPPTTDKWGVKDKPRDIPKRNSIRLAGDPIHEAIQEHGTRKRYSNFKVSVLQVLKSKKQTPAKATPYALSGPGTYWVQTTMQLHEDGALPFSELPGMHPRVYTFDKFWEIPRRKEGTQLKGVPLGVAQYVLGTFDLESKRKIGTMKSYIDNEPFWLNMEVFKAARVLIKEVSAQNHQEDMSVRDWGHAFVHHPSEINSTRALQERFPKLTSVGRWVHLSALVEHLYSVNLEGFNSLPFHTRGFVRMVPKKHWAAIFILASLMDPDLQSACDEHGFIWARSLENDVSRPHPSFTETDEMDPITKEVKKVRGDGNIDIGGEITSRRFGYVVCTMHEIHEAFNTLVARQGNVQTDTFLCFTTRYSNHIPSEKQTSKDKSSCCCEVSYTDCL